MGLTVLVLVLFFCSSDSVDFRLVGGASHCHGNLEMKRQNEDWMEVAGSDWNLFYARAVCSELDCGSALSVRATPVSLRNMWKMTSECDKPSPNNCLEHMMSYELLEINCSDSVRLVHGSGQCSGRLEVRSKRSWSSVCGGHMDLQDAQVVCRELGCGPLLLLQEVPYGGAEALLWETFQCEGHESALLDCGSSVSDTCSSGKAVELTCTDPVDVRMEQGASRCRGEVQVKHQGVWGYVPYNNNNFWVLKAVDAFCRRLDCGSAVSASQIGRIIFHVHELTPSCVHFTSTLRDCVKADGRYNSLLRISCSDSVRLVQGSSLCSGRLEVRSNQTWSSVCEEDLDHNDAQVVCRELGCGAPSVLQGVLYGEGEAPVWDSELHCEGNESAVLDCRRSSSAGKTCSLGKAAGLTCSEPIRLVGQPSRCAGTVEIQDDSEWIPATAFHQWDLKSVSSVCPHLGCGSTESVKAVNSLSWAVVWIVSPGCLELTGELRDCTAVGRMKFYSTVKDMHLVCSDVLPQPNISLSVSADGVSEAYQQGFRLLVGSDFTITCSIQPQYPGGSFQLISKTRKPQNHTLPAVNHSAPFLFSAAGPAHRGYYTCVYHVDAFNHSLSSSQSQVLYVTIGASVVDLIIRVVVIVMSLLVFDIIAFIYYKRQIIISSRPI